MERLIDHGILYVAGLFLLAGTKGWVRPVLAALLALIYVAFSNYVESGNVRLVLSAILTGGCCFLPGLMCFLPLVCYDCVWLLLERSRIFFAGTAGIGLLAASVLVRGGKRVGPQPEWFVFLLVIAGLLAYRMRRHLQQKEAYIHLKDSSTELRLVMQKRQQELMENRIMRSTLPRCRSGTGLHGKSMTMSDICFPVQFYRWGRCRQSTGRNRCTGSSCRSMTRSGRR